MKDFKIGDAVVELYTKQNYKGKIVHIFNLPNFHNTFFHNTLYVMKFDERISAPPFSLLDFMVFAAFNLRLDTPTIQIGKYEVGRISKDKIQVGCQEVDRATIEKILALLDEPLAE